MLSMAMNWDQVAGLDTTIVRSGLIRPVNVETMLSKDNNLLARGRMISVLNEKNEVVKLGEVSATRPLIKHEEAMDLVTNELNQVGVPYKLRVSHLDPKKFYLYQEYILDSSVDAPDGEAIAPFISLRSNYVDGSPVAIDFGTYRYVCSNGCLVVDDSSIMSLKINARNWGLISKTGFSQDIQRSLDHVQNISDFYTKLSQIPLADGYKTLFSVPQLPLGARKKILAAMETAGQATIDVVTDKTDVMSFAKLLKEEDLQRAVIDRTVQIHDDSATMWDLYNMFTDHASHRSQNINGMVYLQTMVDKAFRKALVA